MSKKKVIIIGGGFGGLATANLMAEAGFRVTLYEKNEWLGGRAGLLTVTKRSKKWHESYKPSKSKSAFRFDMGPSWYLMPDIFDHFYKLLGENIDENIDLRRLSPSYSAYFKDTFLGSTKIFGDMKRDGQTFESFEPGARAQMHTYLERSSYQYKTATEQFLYKNYDSVFDFFNLTMMREGLKLNVLSNMQKYVSKQFGSPEIQKILQYPLVFLGASPKNAPALYSLMSHVDFKQGVFYPIGGMNAVAESLVTLAKQRGARLKTCCEVESIRIDNEVAKGVVVDGKFEAADIVISGADTHHTDTKLLAKQHRQYTPVYWKRRTMAPSALLLYLGVKNQYPHLSHHNLLFSKDWDKNFRQIFKGRRLPSDPSIYVCNPNKTDPSVAPKGHENLFVLVPIAADARYDKNKLDAFIDSTLSTLESTMHLTNLKRDIVYQKSFCVDDFQSVYNSYKGSALGFAHTLKQTAIFRPRNQHKNINNLLYVGATTVPGIGVPMCLISAELAYKRVINDSSSGPLKAPIAER